ncbi:RNA-guided endonuclease IscB [Endozoicomonas sp. 4G]|uniref:RNA-guided endonuclease IscB n=1 Tax=Endozoicomonas sp. 4G TaxID=2872754 RepID=UPI002078A63B|nr:RNA-guided endonuclease IscB [Endozoicomonas sp. 4G]
MNRVFVFDKNKKPLMPCHPARARKLLNKGKAAVFRRYPFTIILKEREGGDVQPLELKFDVGSKTTGIAVVADCDRGKKVVFAAELQHRGQRVKDSLESRRTTRRARRNRKTRYRKARFMNRTRPEGWLPPSLMSRVFNTETWAKRFCLKAPISDVAVERVKFDMQLMENPDISGVEYQRGTLFGTELRQYLLYRDGHKCSYCKGVSNDPILNIEHFISRALGGSNRIGNLYIACRTCNEEKGAIHPKQWLESISKKKNKNKLDAARVRNVTSILKGKKVNCLKDAAAVNATRNETARRVQAIGLPTNFATGGRTKFNRTQQGYKKEHWIDAACVGESGASVYIAESTKPLIIKAMGRGSRQMCRVDKYGFPRTKAKDSKQVKGFQTGDIVKAIVPAGKRQGTYTGRVSVRTTGSFNIKTESDTIQGISWRNCQKIQSVDGYGYSLL